MSLPNLFLFVAVLCLCLSMFLQMFDLKSFEQNIKIGANFCFRLLKPSQPIESGKMVRIKFNSFSCSIIEILHRTKR